MSKGSRRNLAASVKRRLLDLSRERGEEYNLVVVRYAVERLLYRLSTSQHSDRFILKGAMLFQLWMGQPHRSTRDLDLVERGSSSIAELEEAFREICRQQVEDDGLQFLEHTVVASEIVAVQKYGGTRVDLEARLGKDRLHIQVDIGFGDAVTPAPESIAYPTLLGLPAPRLRAYPKVSMVAEKFQAMASLGILNSRMKDFYDVWLLAQRFHFKGAVLAEAIRATFERRRTSLPTGAPLALTSEFFDDPTKRLQWRAFLERGRLVESRLELRSAVEVLAAFLMPPVEALVTNRPFRMNWPPGGPWR